MESFNGNGHGEFKTNRELLSEIHSTLKDVVKRSDRYDTILFTDKEAGREGLIDKVTRHGKYISFDKKMKIFGTGIAASTGTAYGFWDSIKHFIFK
jgi:hypothetical protein